MSSSLRATAGLAAGDGERGPSFAPDILLAGRYRIARLLAQGGMGEVYEALDQALGERVALKTVRSRLRDRDPRAVERFKREIQLARKVTHPNVCRIFELGFHHDAGRETLFLTMELLAGETLADKIAREGRQSAAAALPLAMQMAAALTAAHDAGVIHLDFKSANVMLVPGREGLRAVVTDFGIAHAPGLVGELQRDDGEMVLGSPESMAPEQVTGQPAGVPADIYALGVVLYEMRTGHLPFEGGNQVAVALRRLKQPPPPPRIHAPEIEPEWEAAILGCLAREPEQRPASARAVMDALAGAARRRRRRLPLGGLALAALCAVALGLWRSGTPRPARPPTLAVLALRSAATPDAWRAAALTDALTTALACQPTTTITVVSAEDAARMQLDLALPTADSFAPDSLTRVRAYLGVDVVVAGLVAENHGTLEVALGAQETATGRSKAHVQESASELDLPALALRLATRLVSALGLPPAATDSEALVRASLPRHDDALQAYVEGLTRLRAADLGTARTQLLRTTQLDPDFAPAHAALTEVWLGLEQTERAVASARRAHELAAGLPAALRARVDAAFFAASGQWVPALELYARAFAQQPTLANGLRLARAQADGGRPVPARATLERLRGTDAYRSDPRLGVLESELGWIVDPERARSAVREAIAAAQARGARSALADALALEASIDWVRGDIGEAVAAAERARELHALLGARHRLGADLNALTALRWQQGKLEQATALASEAIALYRDLDNPEQTAVNLGNRGFIAVKRGALAEATRDFDDALRLRGAELPARGVPLLGLAWTHALRGQLDAAARGYAEALPLLRRMPEPYPLGFLLVRQGELLAARNDAAGARRNWDEALAIMARLGMQSIECEIRLAQADLLLREGRIAEAEALAEGARQQLERMGARDLEALAQATIARAALRRGDRARALRAADAAIGLEREHDNRLVALQVTIDREELRCGSQQRPEMLPRVIADSERAGLVEIALLARQALGVCEAASGLERAGRQRLRALAAEARARGYLALAESARSAVAGPAR